MKNITLIINISLYCLSCCALGTKFAKDKQWGLSFIMFLQSVALLVISYKEFF